VSLIFLSSLKAQNIDFHKMKDIYEARQPFLDSIINFPSQKYESLFTNNKDGFRISFWWIPNKNKTT
jgi:hypothetical protein